MLAFVVKQAGPPKSKQVKDPFTGLYAEGTALLPPLPPDRMLTLAEENAIHGSCLEAKAIDAAGHGWAWKNKRDPDKTPSKEQTQPLDEFLESITPEYSFSEMMFQALWESDAVGWASWEVQRDERERINAIFPMPSQTIRATPKDDIFVQIRGGVQRYFIRYGSKLKINRSSGQPLKDIETDVEIAVEVLFFKLYTPRTIYYGVPRWISAVPTIAELTAIREFNVSWFSSAGQQDRSVHIKANDVAVANALAAEMKEQFDEHAGMGHATLVTSGTTDTEVGVTQLAMPSREGHFRLRRGDLVKEVLMSHQMPPFRIGWIDLGALGGGASAAKDMMDTYRHSVVKPRQKFMVDRLMNTIFNPAMGGIDTGGLIFSLNDMDVDELLAAVKEVTQSIGSGVMTPNEGRRKLGLSKSTADGMDDFFIAANLQPMEIAIDPPEPVAPSVVPGAGANGNGGPPKPAAKPGAPRVVRRRYGRQAEDAVDVIQSFEATLRTFMEEAAESKRVVLTPS